MGSTPTWMKCSSIAISHLSKQIWIYPAIHQWLADQPTAGRQELPHPSQEKLNHDDLRLAAGKTKKGEEARALLHHHQAERFGNSTTHGGTDLRKNIEAKKRSERHNNVTAALIRDCVSEQNWHPRDISHLKDWLYKILRDAGLGPLRRKKDLPVDMQIMADCEKARANSSISEKQLSSK